MVHNFKDWPELTNSQLQIYYFDSPHKQIVDDIWVEVKRVIDGDTFMAKWEQRNFEFPIRFSNIAAPELSEEGGLESKAWLAGQIEGEEVLVNVNPKNRVGKWGRLLGNIMHTGVDIGEMSVIAGQAVPWEQRNVGKIPRFFNND